MLKVFIQEPGAEYVWQRWLQRRPTMYTRVKDLADADMLVLTGGADISPSLYGEEPIFEGWYNTSRDEAEWAAIEQASKMGILMFGICRGGQLLNVFNGGKLWQHIVGHGRDHHIKDIVTGETVTTSSVHHQMFRVTDEAVVIGVCNLATEKFAEGARWQAGVNNPDPDVEVCYYPKTRSICVQGHPEFGPQEFTHYCDRLVERYVNYNAETVAA